MQGRRAQVRLIEIIPASVSVFCLLTGLLVLIGWAIDSRLLTTWDMVGPPMNPLTALALVGCGCVIFFFLTASPRLVRIFSWSILMVILANFILGFFAFRLDHVIFTDKVELEYPYNHIAFPTTLCFLLMGTSFLLTSYERIKAAQMVAFSVFFVSLFVLISYIYGNRPLYLFPGKMPMALNTSLSFIFLSAGSMLLKHDKGYVQTFTAPTAGSRLARRLLPLIMLTLLTLGYLRLLFIDMKFLPFEAGLSALIALIVCTFLVVLYFYSSRVNKAEEIIELEKRHVHHLNKKLKQKNDQLIQKNEELERFVYSVSHDIRSPLSGVKNLSSKMLEESSNLTEEQKEWIQLICSTSGSLLEKTSRMLELAKAGKKTIRKSPVNTNKLVHQVVQEIQAGTEDKTINVDSGELPVVKGDKDLLKTVFYNLLLNAVKYSPGKVAEIVVSASRKGREFVFSVRDNGIGFKMKNLRGLFSTFSRLPGSERISGTGLGLSIVKRVVERHGGRVWAKPGDKGGAIFYFSLPA